MDLINDTPWPARRFFGGMDEHANLASVVARASYRIDGTELIAVEEPWPVFAEPIETEHGRFPADDYPLRRGCDLVVTGRASVRQPISELIASVRVGDFANDIRVVGDRHWLPDGEGGLLAGPPQPFREMDIDWTRAYGGETEYEGMTGPHPLNAAGRGYYRTKELAAGQPLPNLEDPRAPILHWDDRPLPVSWGPIDNAPVWQMASWIQQRAADPAVSAEALGEPAAIAEGALDTFVGASPPRNVMPHPPPGSTVQISFGRNEAHFALPRLSFTSVATVGREVIERALALTGVWVMLTERLLVLSYQSRFKYDIRMREQRTLRLSQVS